MYVPAGSIRKKRRISVRNKMIFNLRKITEKNRAYKKFAAIAKRPVFMAVGTFFVAFIALRIFFAVLPYPELTAFEQRIVSTRIYDRNGLLLQIIPLENGLRREFVDYKQIPRNVRKIFCVHPFRMGFREKKFPGLLQLQCSLRVWSVLLAGGLLRQKSTIQ